MLKAKFDKWHSFGWFFMRLAIGFRLLYGAVPVLISMDRMKEVVDFFSILDLPVPTISAYLSVVAQLVCGIFILAGFYIRYASLVMVINFIVAIVAYDIGLPFDKAFPAWVILAASLFFIFSGPGRPAINDQ